MKPQESKNDYFHNMSKIDGYRARSAYKLLQIEERFSILKNAKNVLDLGSAPGSWPQICLEINKNMKIMAVDYKRIGKIEGVKIIKSNVYSEDIEKEILNYYPNGIDVILSDMAPKISGNKNLDNAKTIGLVERALHFAKISLNVNGNFVAKAFQGNDLIEFMKKFKNLFEHSQLFKPSASRKSNREIYIIGRAYKIERKK